MRGSTKFQRLLILTIFAHQGYWPSGHYCLSRKENAACVSLPARCNAVTFRGQPSLLIMRALKLISTILLVLIALTAGLVVAAFVAVICLAVFLTGRLLGYKGFPGVSRNLRRPARPSQSTDPSDAIDVTATEVAPENVRSLPSQSDQRSQFRA